MCEVGCIWVFGKLSGKHYCILSLIIVEYSVVSKLDVGNCRTSINLGVVLVDYFVQFFSCLLLFIFHSQLVDASAQQVVSELQFFDWGFVGVKNLSVLQ